MKILMLGWELPPHNSGGLGVACFHLCKALARQGADIDFILPYQAEHQVDFMTIHAAHPWQILDRFSLESAYDSYKYVHSDGRVEWFNIFDQQASYELAVGHLAERLEYDIIHAHDWLTFRGAMRAKEKTGKPFIAHVHSVESDRAGGNYGNPLVREIESLAFLMTDKIIAVSHHTKHSIMRDYGVPEDKIDVVHNSLNIGDLEPLDQANAYRFLDHMKASGYRVVVNVGRLTIQKGLPNLLRAAQKVVAVQPKTFFLIVGNGEQERELIELAAELGIAKNVIFTSFQRGKNLRDAFAIGDLFVMPSVSEPFGLTPLEAIGYGTPALISKQSGVSEVIHNCLKVDYWDIDAMANQITGVLRHDALRDELQANAFREFEKLSWNTSAEKMFSVYQRHAGAGAT